MLSEVFSQMGAIAALFPGASIATNISAIELASGDLPGLLESLLDEYALPPSRLRLEITETAMMTRAGDAAATIERLQALGIALVLDDFGTGYSSLAYLQRLPIIGLKIDRSFVEHLDRDERALEVVRSIVALATSFGLDTTAEGVENEEQARIVAELGVTFAQGYLFSKPRAIGALGSLHSDLSGSWAISSL
jgi:EAL domain-containing protein (putative c-di-GMP-specific phosphodiesterase class I)